MQGRFITFEGVEGCGKSTHIHRLAEFLQQQGVEVVVTREPGGTPLCEAIRGLLQHDTSGESPVPAAEVLLFLASRAQHVAQLIKPALAAGKWVLCDRFKDSTYAYQGYGRGFNLSKLKKINQFAVEGLEPDLTLLLEVSSETAAHRLNKRSSHLSNALDRIEQETDSFHARCRQGFQNLADEAGARFVRINSEQAVELVAKEIQDVIKNRFLGVLNNG